MSVVMYAIRQLISDEVLDMKKALVAHAKKTY